MSIFCTNLHNNQQWICCTKKKHSELKVSKVENRTNIAQSTPYSVTVERRTLGVRMSGTSIDIALMTTRVNPFCVTLACVTQISYSYKMASLILSALPISGKSQTKSSRSNGLFMRSVNLTNQNSFPLVLQNLYLSSCWSYVQDSSSS